MRKTTFHRSYRLQALSFKGLLFFRLPLPLSFRTIASLFPFISLDILTIHFFDLLFFYFFESHSQSLLLAILSKIFIYHVCSRYLAPLSFLEEIYIAFHFPDKPKKKVRFFLYFEFLCYFINLCAQCF